MNDETTDDQTTTEPREARMRKRFLPWWLVVFVLLSGLTIFQVWGLKQQLGVDHHRVDSLYTALKQEQDAKIKEGQTPVAPPADEIAKNPSVVPGPKGAPGDTGPQGIPGLQGPMGIPGLQGEKGDKGDKGDTVVGPQGIQGIPGIQGPKGDAGANGLDGAAGPAGPPGPAGADGQNATQSQVDSAVNAFCSSANDPCRSTVPGPTGPAGKNAYPFTFTFVIQNNPVQRTTYTCTVSDPAQPATCTTN